MDLQVGEVALDPPRASSAEPHLGVRLIASLGWTLRLLAALLLFVGALQVMKHGAGALSILSNDSFLIRNSGSTLGLGWLGSLFVLSGSPVAASSLTLVAGGSLTEVEGFTMLTGSRLGAAFVVLLVAVIYALRGGRGKRAKPLSTAVVALCATALVYVPATFVGLMLLRSGSFRNLEISTPPQFADVIDRLYGGLLSLIDQWPGGIVFLGGLALLIFSMKLIDSVIPELSDEAIGSPRAAWLKQKWPMFGLGCVVALVTMSVAVALAVLVPLVAKDRIQRKDILPYIMGANITTLGDTLLAAFVLGSPAAVRIVLAGLIGSTIVTLLILAFLYEPARYLISRFQLKVISSRPSLLSFTAAIFLIPLSLLLGAGMAP